MMNVLTVGALKEALKDVPDDVQVELSSDSGVDQGDEQIIVEDAKYVHYNDDLSEARFYIYANYIEND